MTEHSPLVGGSNADRVLNCPGSYQATIALPASADRSSESADEGTAMHAVMAALMTYAMNDNRLSLPEVAYGMLGQWFHDRALTEAHLDTMILPALLALAELKQAYAADPTVDDFEVLAVEKRVKFPRIPGAFGSCDLILANTVTVLHVDWKFGQGVGVKAVYRDHDSADQATRLGERVNPQLMFYVAGARNSARHFYTGGKQLVGAIIQPRGDTPLSHTVISNKEVRWFVEDLERAVIAALGHAPQRIKGEWCRFAPCKLDCPLWTGPLLDLSALKLQPRTEPVTRLPSPYGDYLARAKALVDIMALFKTEVDKQLHAYLEDGGLVAGWRLKRKTTQRQWIAADTVEQELRALGFSTTEIWQTKLQTFEKADAAAKRLKVKIPDHLRVAPPTSETTVCATDDPAPVVDRQLAVEQFRASLAALKGTV